MRWFLGLAGAWARMRAPRAVAVAAAPYGRVITVRGLVVPRDVLESPLSGAACVYFRYHVEDWRRSRVLGEGGGFWQIAEEDEAIVEFYLDDGSARAIVAPGSARVHAARGVGGATVELETHRRAHELLIEPGDELAVTGHAVEVADLFDDSRSYRAAPQRLMLRAPEAGTLDIRLLRKRAPAA